MADVTEHLGRADYYISTVNMILNFLAYLAKNDNMFGFAVRERILFVYFFLKLELNSNFKILYESLSKGH